MDKNVFIINSDELNDKLMQSVDIHHLNAKRVALDTLSNFELINETKKKIYVENAIILQTQDDISDINNVLEMLENKNFDFEKMKSLLKPSDLMFEEVVQDTLSMADNGILLGDDDIINRLLTEEEIISIRNHLSRPTFERYKWHKGDYLVVFLSSFICLLLEGLNMAWRVNSPIKESNELCKWFDEKLHNHAGNSPIDYQGAHFGGGNHRVRTAGHDIARFFEAIRQTMDGEFRGVYWKDKTPFEIITTLNQYGNKYPQMDFFAALVNVSLHLFADFFSQYSLPLPFSSVVFENGSREFRKFVADLYDNGFNLRHISINGLQVFLSWITMKIWLWLQYDDTKTDSVKMKEYEMRLAITGMLSAANISGCVFYQNPFLINIPALVGTIDNAVKLYLLNNKRKSQLFKEIRNIDDLLEQWAV